MSHLVSSRKSHYGVKRKWSRGKEGKTSGDKRSGVRGRKRSYSSRSLSASSVSSSSSSIVSSRSSRSSEERKHYPIFTAEYAKRVGRGNVPFLRTESCEQQQSTLSLLRLRDMSSATWTKKSSRCILYNEYVFIRELGKGTYAKVVLCRSLRTGDLLALKIFRNEESYKEACWDEVGALEALCRPILEGDRQQHEHNNNSISSSGGGGGGNTNNKKNKNDCGSGGGGDGIHCSSNGTEMMSGILWSYAHNASAVSQGHMGRFNVPIAHLPHPIHHAIVLPALGPSLLDILRHIRGEFVKSEADLTSGSKGNLSTNHARQEHTSSHRDVVDVHYTGMPLDLVRSVLYQIFLFLRHAHLRGIVHTDLKPENVLFETSDRLMTRLHIVKRRHVYMSFQPEKGPAENGEFTAASSLALPSDSLRGSMSEGHTTVVDVSLPALNAIRVIDVGAAEFLSNCRHISVLDGVTPVFYHRIHTTHYRSVEVLLGLGWTNSTDMWSVGCMIPELLTGECVFMPRNDLEHLALMQHIVGSFNGTEDTSIVSRVFAKGSRFKEYFDTHTMRLVWPPNPNLSSSSSLKQCKRHSVLEEDIRYVASRPTLQEVLEPFPHLYDLCRRLLDYDPLRRITAAEALQHPFFTSAQ